MSFDSDKLTDILNRYMRDMEEDKNRVNNLLKTKGYNIFFRVLDYLSLNGSLSDYSFVGNGIPDLLEYEYESLCDYVIYYCGTNYFVDDREEFENRVYYIEHEGKYIELFVMYGQGSYRCLNIIDDLELKDRDIVISSDDLLDNIALGIS